MVKLSPALPDRIGGRYEVLSLLASGGMADVYLARDTTLDRRVAVKVLRDPTGTARFRGEAQLLAQLRHPSLVAVLDLGEVDGRPYLVLELVEGRTLADLCRGQALAPGEVARIGAEVASALAHCHRAGVVHRDVSPGNVLLSEDGRAHLADFGIARLLEDPPVLTEAGQTLGTIPYLAPEQVTGDAHTAGVDVYALGLVLLEALTGQRAFEGTTTEAAVARLHRDPEVPETLPAAWRQLLATMTARDPGARPTAQEVQARLGALAESDAGATRALTMPLPLAPTPPRRADRLPFSLRVPLSVPRLPVAVWAGLAVLTTVLLLLALPGGSGDRPPVPVPSGVPSGVADELQRLHDAVAGR